MSTNRMWKFVTQSVTKEYLIYPPSGDGEGGGGSGRVDRGGLNLTTPARYTSYASLPRSQGDLAHNPHFVRRWSNGIKPNKKSQNKKQVL